MTDLQRAIGLLIELAHVDSLQFTKDEINNLRAKGLGMEGARITLRDETKARIKRQLGGLVRYDSHGRAYVDDR